MQPPRRERDVSQQHAGVHREVVDPLLRLLDQRVAVHLPRQVFGTAPDLLERLVDRHRADRHGGVPDDPLARFMDVPSGGEIHHGVGAPERRPTQFVDLFLDRRCDRGIADVRVDLHQEVPADDHRLDLRVVDVRRQDGPPAGNLIADELRIQPFAHRDERHLRRHLASSCIVQLGDRACPAKHPPPERGRNLRSGSRPPGTGR